MYLLSIDPGTSRMGWCFWVNNLPRTFGTINFDKNKKMDKKSYIYQEVEKLFEDKKVFAEYNKEEVGVVIEAVFSGKNMGTALTAQTSKTIITTVARQKGFKIIDEEIYATQWRPYLKVDKGFEPAWVKQLYPYWFGDMDGACAICIGEYHLRKQWDKFMRGEI